LGRGHGESLRRIPFKFVIDTPREMPMNTRNHWILGLPLVALALTGMVSTANAQGAGIDTDRTPSMENRRLERAIDELNLSDSQKDQLRSLRENHRVATEGLRAQIRSAQQTLAKTPPTDPNYDTLTAQARRDLESARSQLRDQQQLFQSNARSLLTPDQLNTMEAQRAERRQRMQDRREGRMERRPGKRPRG